MDLKFKKLLLLTMKINNANKLMIKASPTKIINLQTYANVIDLNQIHITYELKLKFDIDLISGNDYNLQHCHLSAENNKLTNIKFRINVQKMCIRFNKKK